MTALTKGLYALLAFVVGGFVLWLMWTYVIKKGIEDSVRESIQLAGGDSAIARQEDRVTRVDTVYRTQLREYPVYRDRLVAANPDNKPLADLAGRCDQLILTCEGRVAAGDALADTLRAQIEQLKDMKERKPPRLSAYALAGYDWMNSNPLAQVGGEARILGPLSITAWIEGARTKADEKMQARGVVALRFTFR